MLGARRRINFVTFPVETVLTLLRSGGGGHDGPMFRRLAAVLARIEIMSSPLVTF